MSPVVTLVLGALLYYAAVTGRAEAVWLALKADPASTTRKGQQDPVNKFFVLGDGTKGTKDAGGDIP